MRRKCRSPPPAKKRKVWYPKNLEQQRFLVDIYQDATSSETSDVVFSVGGNDYHVHKLVLSVRCKKLYEFVKDCTHSMPIPIDSTRKEVFKCILDFVYTVKLPCINDKDFAMEVLIAADIYECVQLKLYVESVLVDKMITPGNAAELFLFADAHSCALLREKAMNIFVANIATVKKTADWSKIKTNNRLLLEVFEAVTSVPNSTNDVTSLREQLEAENLELDGSYKMLAERLKEHERKSNLGSRSYESKADYSSNSGSDSGSAGSDY